MRKALRELLDRLYAKRLSAQIVDDKLPKHVGIMVDGNRRWARSVGLGDPSDGHRVGGAKIQTFLQWCDSVNIEHVTIWLLSDDNLKRAQDELTALIEIIDNTVAGLAGDGNPWKLDIIGAPDVLPGDLAKRLKQHAARTTGRTKGAQVNIAVGYGGQREIADAVRSAIDEHLASGAPLEDLAENFDADAISRHIYTAGQPNADLIIRTSGEQRLSGFMLWQSAYAEVYFCECHWPAFRKIDFLRALRSYSARERRYGR
ncbi:isoprenyl transferase [Streptomyces caniferus]|uniref:isoprenyl transferase n=1 Tax=Streptomyces caniferus TaxID=285557 RepID=UPI0037F9689D